MYHREGKNAMMRVCGFDEAGRGPLAGPVVAACVILGEEFPKDGITDSKVLSASSREKWDRVIREQAIAWGIGVCGPDEIDRINILRASLVAMRLAWEDLLFRFPSQYPDSGIVDGLFVPELPFPCIALVRGDLLEPCVSAASILAKVYRDREMERLNSLFPGYGFAKHKGYPTKEHKQALAELGPSSVHRLSFRW
jgi:ribonuclease HII